jgi:hypothetical protein
MRDQLQIEALERIYDLVSRSFLRYVIEAAMPWATPPGGADGGPAEWDARALAALRAWHGDAMASRARIEELLTAEKTHPVPPLWPLSFSQYNLITPSYLLRPVIERMEDHLADLREEAPGVRGWPEAEEAVRDLLTTQASHLATVKSLEAARPKPPPKPAVKKGVSANFW